MMAETIYVGWWKTTETRDVAKIAGLAKDEVSKRCFMGPAK